MYSLLPPNLQYISECMPIIMALATIGMFFVGVVNVFLVIALNKKDARDKKKTLELHNKIVASTIAATYGDRLWEQNYRDILKRLSSEDL